MADNSVEDTKLNYIENEEKDAKKKLDTLTEEVKKIEINEASENNKYVTKDDFNTFKLNVYKYLVANLVMFILFLIEQIISHHYFVK